MQSRAFFIRLTIDSGGVVFQAADLDTSKYDKEKMVLKVEHKDLGDKFKAFHEPKEDCDITIVIYIYIYIECIYM